VGQPAGGQLLPLGLRAGTAARPVDRFRTAASGYRPGDQGILAAEPRDLSGTGLPGPSEATRAGRAARRGGRPLAPKTPGPAPRDSAAPVRAYETERDE